MILEEALKRYYEATATASKIVRQLALSGIAFIWVLSGGSQLTGLRIGQRLLWAGLLLSISLMLDVIKYLSYSFTVHRWTKQKEDKLAADGLESSTRLTSEIGDVPKSVLAPGLVFYWAKVATAFAAYVLIAVELGSRIYCGS